ncbi:MAG TPA: tRNA (adenosine(37)-N6)-threonylcarbamoyltransferase complex ATPase subunit type 1 TsaE [Ignavibacteriaceae bacterium]|nr:tRNA (adenosine(37)-N6)-threonylcarbamoyltransferase complex ATPase subunit type 1 TsaE [Ignavibacteriaceae bacterium]
MAIDYSRKSNSEEDTNKIAIEFSKLIVDGMIISLIGNLGAGKTYFIKRILEQFDINNANSPTFAIVNEYTGTKKFYHFDFYRINKEVELIDIGIEDYFNDDEAISFIEWADLFPKVIPHKKVEITINVLDDNSRIFKFKQYE